MQLISVPFKIFHRFHSIPVLSDITLLKTTITRRTRRGARWNKNYDKCRKRKRRKRENKRA